MGRKRSHTPLNVFMNGRLVGQIQRERAGSISFAYSKDWLSWEHRLPVSLSLPLSSNQYVGARVLAVLENLLPDNEHVRNRIAVQVGAAGMDAFSLLSEIGRDCIGTLQFLPDGDTPTLANRPSGEPQTDEQIAALLTNIDENPLGIRREHDFRISVAGAQNKTALLYHEGQWIKPTGPTPTTHIIKPQIGRLPNGMDLSNSVENEYFCLELIKAFGLRAAKAEIATFGMQRALVVERFDRRWTPDGRLIRLPHEDCCQALSVPPTRKYQNEGGPGIVEIMGLLSGSDEQRQDRYDFLKANVLFWLIGATDGHAKNFSLGLFPGGRFKMAPLYDVLTVQPMVDKRQIERKHFRLAMRMGNSRKYRVSDIFQRHIAEIGTIAGFSKDAVPQIFDDISSQADTALEHTISALPESFPSEIVDSVTNGFKARSARLQEQ